jgi:raffinose/stachyose/melibiose transport system permease protein
LSKYTWRTFSREVTLLGGAALFCIPIYLLVTISLKTTTETYLSPLSFPRDPSFGSFSAAWSPPGSTVGLGRALRNSVVITGGSVLFLMAFGSIAAWVVARRASKVSTVLYLFFTIGIIIPAQLAIIPIYAVMNRLHLLGTYAGMIALYTALLMPFSVFLYTGFVRVLPREYEEAAQVDGAGLWRTFTRVVFPLLRPISGTVAVLTGIIVWNDFFLPVIFMPSSANIPLPVAVYGLVSENLTRWNVIFAAIIISIIPVLVFYVVAQRQLMRGFGGGIKG